MRTPSSTLFFRVGSIGAITLAVLSPKIQWPLWVEDPHIAVVWDESASMAETDTPTGHTRWAQARAVFEKAQPGLSPATFHHYVWEGGFAPPRNRICPH